MLAMLGCIEAIELRHKELVAQEDRTPAQENQMKRMREYLNWIKRESGQKTLDEIDTYMQD